MATKAKAPISLRIRLKYPDEDTFVASYAPNISRGGIFIQSRTPQPEGTALRFELVLKDSTRLLRGEGYVVWVKEYDASQPAQPYGMGVRFTRLDDDSQRLVDRVLRFKDGAGLTPAEPPPRSETQEFRRIADNVELTDADEPQQRTGVTGESRRVRRQEAAPASASESLAATAAPAEPATEPIVFERRARPRPSKPDGDGAHERCRWADAQLRELLDSASLPVAAVEAALQGALEYALSAGDGLAEDLDGLQELLAPSVPPTLDPATAREELRQLLGASAAPEVTPLATEPPASRERYIPAPAPVERTPAETANAGEPAPAETADAAADEPPAELAATPDAEPRAVAVAQELAAAADREDDSGFEEFSPIAEAPAADELGDRAPDTLALAPPLDTSTREPQETPRDTPHLELESSASDTSEHPGLDLVDETMVSALGAPLGGVTEPDLERPAPRSADERVQPPGPVDYGDERPTTIDELSDPEDTNTGSVTGIGGATIPQADPWLAEHGRPGSDEDLTDVADRWAGAQDTGAAERYDDLEHGTDPDAGDLGQAAADEGLDDVTVDLGRDDALDGPGDFATADRSAPELLGDELAQDPDLNNEVFEALAGVRELAAAPPPAGTAGPAESAHGARAEEAPSLELLANRARRGTPAHGIEQLPEDAGGDALNIVVDDDEQEAAEQDQKPAVRAHKSGLFRRLFGRKDS